MTEREIYEKYGNLSEDELIIKSNKNVFVKSIVMTNIIKHCRGEKKRGIKVIGGFRKTLMIPDFEISVRPEHEVKSKIGTIFVNEEILEEHSVKVYEIDHIFMSITEKKIQTDENGCEYILFRIDIYFTKCFLAVETDGKGHTDKDLIFEEKRQKALEKELNCEFVRINTSRGNYDVSYEASRIQTFISNSNKNKIKELEDEIKKLRLQLANQIVENNNNHKR